MVLEPSLLAVILTGVIIVGGTIGWRMLRKTQIEILTQTTRILALCESVETFYEHAVESQKVIELAVAAGIAHETLQETLQASMTMLN